MELTAWQDPAMQPRKSCRDALGMVMCASMMHRVSQVPIACGRQHKHLILMSLCPRLTFVGGMLLVYLCGCWYGPSPAAAFLWLVLSGLGFLFLGCVFCEDSVRVHAGTIPSILCAGSSIPACVGSTAVPCTISSALRCMKDSSVVYKKGGCS